ncbi:MAG: hypothetical protein IT445_13060 [Phycisphaeraceae bacterium]|nr:hypothetical protein [Phycisphaeraceae bacterium]
MLSSFHRFSLIAVISLFAAAPIVLADEPTTMAQMAQELAELRSEVAQLRADRDQTWLNERRAEEVKTLIREVLNDADQRAALLDNSVTAGYDGKFFIASADNAFRLNLSGVAQVRYVANSRENSGQDDVENGFVLRRIEVAFSGHIADPRITYLINLATCRETEIVNLQDMILRYAFNDNWSIYGGRTKAPVLREEIISWHMQQMIERSLVNLVFSPEYAEGVGLTYQNDDVRVSVMFNDGARSGSYSGIDNDYHADQSDYAISARGEYKLAGEWNQINDFEAWSGAPTSSVLGAAIHHEVGETGDSGASGANDKLLVWTVDASLERDGLGLYGAVIGRHVDNEAATGLTRDDLAVILQGGYMLIPDKLEPYVRYEWIDADDAVGSEDQLHIVTVGFNYFFNKDRVKLSFDVAYALDPVVASNTLGSGGPCGAGFLTDAAGEDGQLVARAQFQCKF